MTVRLIAEEPAHHHLHRRRRVLAFPGPVLDVFLDRRAAVDRQRFADRDDAVLGLRLSALALRASLDLPNLDVRGLLEIEEETGDEALGHDKAALRLQIDL